MAKWILAAALFSSMATLTQAAGATPAEAMGAPVRIEVRGILHVMGDLLAPPKDGDDVIHACLPPLRQYVVEANGQRFTLNLARFVGLADKLNGRLVIVKGTLDLDTITVTDIAEPIDDALIQYVRVTIEGELERESLGFPRCGEQVEEFVWRVRVGKVSYTLTFADARAEAAALKLVGKKVVVQGTFKDGVVHARSVEKAFDIHRLLPWIVG